MLLLVLVLLLEVEHDRNYGNMIGNDRHFYIRKYITIAGIVNASTKNIYDSLVNFYVPNHRLAPTAQSWHTHEQQEQAMEATVDPISIIINIMRSTIVFIMNVMNLITS